MWARQSSWLPAFFMTRNSSARYSGTTGIAELAWVTTALSTATRASPPSPDSRSRMAAAARSRSSLALPRVACQ